MGKRQGKRHPCSERLRSTLKAEGGLVGCLSVDRGVAAVLQGSITFPLPGFPLTSTGNIAWGFGARDDNPPRGGRVLSYFRDFIFAKDFTASLRRVLEEWAGSLALPRSPKYPPKNSVAVSRNSTGGRV